MGKNRQGNQIPLNDKLVSTNWYRPYAQYSRTDGKFMSLVVCNGLSIDFVIVLGILTNHEIHNA